MLERHGAGEVTAGPGRGDLVGAGRAVGERRPGHSNAARTPAHPVTAAPDRVAGSVREHIAIRGSLDEVNAAGECLGHDTVGQDRAPGALPA